jgi:N-acetylglucosaminyldiphosphoundecaprenol N-acetyl-beta-D-mannosaminyltransferase
VDVTPRSVDEVLAAIDNSPRAERHLILGHNLHSVYLSHTNEEFATVYRLADLVLVDGQPLRWAGKLASSSPEDEWRAERRVGSVDWIRRLGDLKSIDRIAVVGACAEANQRTVDLLMQKVGASVRGWNGENWSHARAALVVDELALFDADLTLIGLGMPLQEQFFMSWRRQLPTGIYALVGGAIDQISGVQKRSPAWVGRLGLEWLWRLILSPRRLSHRYLVEPFKLAAVLVRPDSRAPSPTPFSRIRHEATRCHLP